MRRSAALTISLLWLGVPAVLGLGSGCGYALAGSGLEGAGTIAIRTPENATQEPGAEIVVADALRRELLRRDGDALSEDPTRADWVVHGRVLHVRSRARSFSSAVLGREYDLQVRLALSATRRDGQELEPALANLSESERYLASADVEVQRKNKQEALRRVSDMLAARFFDELGEALPAGSPADGEALPAGPPADGEALPAGSPADGEAFPAGSPADGEALPAGSPAEGEAQPAGAPAAGGGAP